MMVTDRDVMAQREYYRDQARAAARYAMVRLALKSRGPREHVGTRALVWLGGRLVRWGTSLRERYSEVVSTPLTRPANHAAYE
jgi:hypothetical protein